MASMPASMETRARENQTTQQRKKDSRKPAKLSRLYKPAHLSLEEWQIQLRRQFGREQNFTLKNVAGSRTPRSDPAPPPSSRQVPSLAEEDHSQGSAVAEQPTRAQRAP